MLQNAVIPKNEPALKPRHFRKCKNSNFSVIFNAEQQENTVISQKSNDGVSTQQHTQNTVILNCAVVRHQKPVLCLDKHQVKIGIKQMPTPCKNHSKTEVPTKGVYIQISSMVRYMSSKGKRFCSL